MKYYQSLFNLKSSEILLLSLIRQYSPSRKELSQLSGLTAGAITQYCRKLLFLGLIKETEKLVKKRGKVSYHLTINPTACCSIGFSFSEKEFQIAIVDFGGNKIANEHYTWQKLNNIDNLCQQLKQSLIKLLERKCLTEARILGIGFSLSGYLLADQSISSPWFPLLKNIPNLAQVLSEKLAYPCYIENNINAIALGEYYSGLWNDINDMVVISLDFGIGAGVISQGKLIRGGFGNAGEIGLLFPYGELRPSWQSLKDILEQQNIESSAITENAVANDWLKQTKQQVLALILSAIAWLDPKVIVVTGMLPIEIINDIVDYAKHSKEIALLNRQVAELNTSKMNIDDIATCAAIVPVYHFFQSNKYAPQG